MRSHPKRSIVSLEHPTDFKLGAPAFSRYAIHSPFESEESLFQITDVHGASIVTSYSVLNAGKRVSSVADATRHMSQNT
jgi:hypothetical protein